MYKDDYEYKRYKEEYDAYQNEKQELIEELEKEEEKERSMYLREASTKIKNEKKYDFIVMTQSDFIFAVERVNNVDQFDLYELDRYIKTFKDRSEMLDFLNTNVDLTTEKLTSL